MVRTLTIYHPGTALPTGFSLRTKPAEAVSLTTSSLTTLQGGAGKGRWVEADAIGICKPVLFFED